jgi:hypothetical protein
MKRPSSHISGLSLLLAAGQLAAVGATNSGVAGANYGGYEILATRNIFDGSRNTNEVVPQVKPPKIDSFTLTGTLTSGKGRFAFFEGNVIQHRNAAFAPAEKIGGFTIAGITGDGVRLESAGRPAILLRVGAQMTRQDEGAWTLDRLPPSENQP